MDFFYKDWHWILKSCLFAERKTGTGSEWKQQSVNTVECAWKKQRQEGAWASGAQRERNWAFILPMICKSNLSTGHLQAVCWIWRQTGGCKWIPVSQALDKPFLWCADADFHFHFTPQQSQLRQSSAMTSWIICFFPSTWNLRSENLRSKSPVKLQNNSNNKELELIYKNIKIQCKTQHKQEEEVECKAFLLMQTDQTGLCYSFVAEKSEREKKQTACTDDWQI